MHFCVSRVTQGTLTVELGLLERLNLADVDVLHGVDALHGLEDLSRDVFGDTATRDARTTTRTATKRQRDQTHASKPSVKIRNLAKTEIQSEPQQPTPYAVGMYALAATFTKRERNCLRLEIRTCKRISQARRRKRNERFFQSTSNRKLRLSGGTYNLSTSSLRSHLVASSVMMSHIFLRTARICDAWA